ncbi:MAG: hypothetical protein FJ390_07805 [Verrucomicrobia bacterium]|nr:hypothetical protein [Verrucomicrobiota bacterium]
MNLDLTPAHLHLALNHIPIIGLAFASLPILVGILAQSRTTIAAGLLATLLCAGAMPTIMQTGSEASHSFKEGKTLPPLDDAGKIALHMHAGRADKTAPVVYACAILALLALLALVKFPQAALWLSSAVLLGNAISISLGIWTAQAGGRIRHAEFRPATPWDTPPTPTPTTAATSTPAVMSTPTPTPVATSTNTPAPTTSTPAVPPTPTTP